MHETHPAFAALQPWLGSSVNTLTIDHLNALVSARAEPPRTDSGAGIRFVAPAATRSAAAYETGILNTGAVPTRPGSRHDAFNALCWIAFPRFKRAINALHAAQIARAGAATATPRGPLRDALTSLDESGVLVLCGEPVLGELLSARQWSALFCDRRAAVSRALRFLVCGHALFEKLQQPYPTLTGRVLIIPAPMAILEADDVRQRCFADDSAAARLRAAFPWSRPRRCPSPVFRVGIRTMRRPGSTAMRRSSVHPTERPQQAAR